MGLALAGLLPEPLHAQDFKVNIGGGNADQAKADKELADKLPPDQAEAYLKNRHAWSTVGDTLQYLAVLALPVSIVALVLTFRHRRQKLAHETMRLMIEKGLPVPPELINPPPPAKRPTSDLRRGLIWLALGLGLSILFLKVFEDSGLWALGLIPAFIGAAHLLCWGIGVVRERRESERTGGDLWPGIFWTLFGIAVNEFRARLRRDRRQQWNEPDDRAAHPEPIVEAPPADLRLDLDEALRRLTLPERAAILLCCQHGLTHEAAAQALRSPLGTVKTNILRGKEKLRRWLEL